MRSRGCSARSRHRRDVLLDKYVRQLRANSRLPPLRPARRVTGRRGIRTPALLFDPHPRSSGLLRVLPADKPLAFADACNRNTGGELDRLLGVVARQEVGQTPAGLGITCLPLGGVEPIIDLATIQSYPQASLATGQLGSCASPSNAPNPLPLMQTNLCSRPIGGRSQCAANGTRLVDDHVPRRATGRY
jgi:hypothetical protein